MQLTPETLYHPALSNVTGIIDTLMAANDVLYSHAVNALSVACIIVLSCLLAIAEEYEDNSDRYWNNFYTQHQNHFFKDRHWLFTEFPELAPFPSTTDCVIPQTDVEASISAEPSCDSVADAEESFLGEKASTRMLEVGCGVGNTVLPILRTNM